MSYGEATVQWGDEVYRNSYETFQLPNDYYISVANVQSAAADTDLRDDEQWRPLYAMHLDTRLFAVNSLVKIGGHYVKPTGDLKDEPYAAPLANSHFNPELTMRPITEAPKVILRTFSIFGLGLCNAYLLIDEQDAAIKQGWLNVVRAFKKDVQPQSEQRLGHQRVVISAAK